MSGANCRGVSTSCLSPSTLNSARAAKDVPIRDVLSRDSPIKLPCVSNVQNPILRFERASTDCANSHMDIEETVACNSVQYVPSTGTPKHKSMTELKNEISVLEYEIARLERYLLSLYRTAFEDHLSPPPHSTDTQSKYDLRSPSCKVKSELGDKAEIPVKRTGLLRSFQSSPAHYWTSSESQSCSSSFNTRSLKKKSGLGHHSLADHLSPSVLETPRDSAEKLSEDIVRCISSIYCKLVDPTSQVQANLSASPTSSFSSSSIFSSHHPRDSLSPSRNEDGPPVHQFHKFRGESGRYGSMVEVLKICLDDESFKFAAAMLQKFRSLVRGLENIEPRKMKREEKLAFWINIHNALVMHAHLAYGTGSRAKGTTILKAAYNVGGHSVNAYAIQTSILGIRSNQSAPWLQALFTPGRKSKTGSASHTYALEYPEPLVHFALCSGTYSDPPVRVYASKTVFADLKLAREDYVQANAYIHKESKIFLPRMLYFFAKDMSMGVPGLLDMVGECLSQSQRQIVERFSKGRAERHVQWLPHNAMFRYVIHGDLTTTKPSI
ncbi:hypothetical protein MLD38_000854 [Melastoma candidum]|uniref:Uncharacterized protein n=1 Tax=Melastoma candidum TaxID=119954 RepID=A0ACB9SFC2_9MYRT|nr:hypothetical protein MLD38_000854 [Melastoma candidum]